MKRLFQICAALWCAVVFAAQAQVGGIKPGNGHPQQGYFFVGGKYVEGKTGPIMERQMYVEYRFPAKVTQKYPIVMIHGAAQTGTNFTGTTAVTFASANSTVVAAPITSLGATQLVVLVPTNAITGLVTVTTRNRGCSA